MVCLRELTALDVMVKDELLHDTSAVIAIEGDLVLQVCYSCDMVIIICCVLCVCVCVCVCVCARVCTVTCM